MLRRDDMPSSSRSLSVSSLLTPPGSRPPMPRPVRPRAGAGPWFRLSGSEAPPDSSQMSSATRGFRIGRIAGVEVRLDWSLLIVFWLIVMSLGGGMFPARHPDWSPLLIWGMAGLAAVLFLASILAHEL